jgi:hypothetical protein
MRPGTDVLSTAGIGDATGGAGESEDAASNSARIVRMRSGNSVGLCHMAQRVRTTNLLGSFGSRASVVRRHLEPRSHMLWPGFGPKVKLVAAGWTAVGSAGRG